MLEFSSFTIWMLLYAHACVIQGYPNNAVLKEEKERAHQMPNVCFVHAMHPDTMYELYVRFVRAKFPSMFQRWFVDGGWKFLLNLDQQLAAVVSIKLRLVYSCLLTNCTRANQLETMLDMRHYCECTLREKQKKNHRNMEDKWECGTMCIVHWDTWYSMVHSVWESIKKL